MSNGCSQSDNTNGNAKYASCVNDCQSETAREEGNGNDSIEENVLPAPIARRLKALKLGKQFVRFSCVSFTAFLIDFGLLALLTSGFGVHYLISNAISFTISIIYSYILSMRFVFTHKEGLDRRREFIIFLLLSFIGLGINELLMWVFKGIFGIAYLASKVLAGLLGALWNFWSRKHFLDAG